MTNRSASISVGGVATELGMPGLPGVVTTSAVRARTWASACSRPPPPTTQTFTCRNPGGRGWPQDMPSESMNRLGELDELLTPGADADQPDRDSGLPGQELDVVLGRRRHFVQLGGAGEVRL